jgi:hypothetical protein
LAITRSFSQTKKQPQHICLPARESAAGLNQTTTTTAQTITPAPIDLLAQAKGQEPHQQRAGAQLVFSF